MIRERHTLTVSERIREAREASSYSRGYDYGQALRIAFFTADDEPVRWSAGYAPQATDWHYGLPLAD